MTGPCSPSPRSETDVEELRRTRSNLQNHGRAAAQRYNQSVSRSATMSRSAGLSGRQVHRSSEFTLPIVIPDGSGVVSLDVSANNMVYKVDNGTDVSFEELLSSSSNNRVTITKTSGAEIIHAYTDEITENGKKVSYAVRYTFGEGSALIYADQVLSPPTLDSAENKVPTDSGGVFGLGIETIQAVVSGEVIISVFRSEEGQEFKPYTVTKGQWNTVSEATHEQMLITEGPAPGNEAYPIDPDMPYGYFFKKIRPPGFDKTWKKVATKAYSVALAEKEIPNGVDRTAQARSIELSSRMRNAIIDGSLICLSFESNGGQLYLPVNRFEIRPKKGSRPVPNLNILDTGPHPRTTPNGKVISTPHRPATKTIVVKGKRKVVPTKLFSAGGSYQYVLKTWRGLYRRYGGIFGLEASEGLWVWQARPEAQAWLQSAALTDTFTRWTAGLPAGLDFPTIYIALMVHINNVAPTCAEQFLTVATRRIINSGTSDYRRAHEICKVVYDGQAWLIRKHLGYFNKARNKMIRVLPKKDATSYMSQPQLLPGLLK